MTTTQAPDPTTDTKDATSAVFASLVGINALIVLAQGLFAGVFLRFDGKRDASAGWIDAHAWGAHLGTVLAFVTAGYAFMKLRERTPLVVGSGLLALAFLVESYIGGAIRDDGKDSWTSVHVPIAMAIMGLTVWLSVKAVQLKKAAA